MDIHQLAENPGDDVFYSPGFMNILESHFTYLLQSAKTTQLSLDPQMVYRYEGDLFGLLTELQINKEYHILIMRLNGFRCPGDLSPEQSLLLIPDLEEVQLLKTVYKTQNVLM